MLFAACRQPLEYLTGPTRREGRAFFQSAVSGQSLQWGLLLAGLILIGLNGCATLQVPSTWAGAANAVSGESGDTIPNRSGSGHVPIQPAWTYINDDNAIVAASNDSQYLHVMLRFRTLDAKWARNCAMTGLTVWLNAAGKKKKDFGIRIASGPSREDLSPWESGDTGQGTRSRFEANRVMSPSGDVPISMRPRLDGGLTIIYPYPDSTVAAPADGSLGPNATFETQNGVCTYDLSVPITGLSSQRLGLSVAPGKVVMVGLTAGPSEAERAAMEQRFHGVRGEGGGDDEPGEGMGGHQGGWGGGGRQGEGMGGGGHPGAEVQESPEDWVKLQLAKAATGGTK